MMAVQVHIYKDVSEGILWEKFFIFLFFAFSFRVVL